MKKRHWLYLPLIIFFIGFFYTTLIYNGIWFKFTEGLGSLSIIGYFLWLIFAFYFTLTLHELGHFIAFHFQGVKLRAIYLTIFVFYKDEKRWHFTIKPKLWVLFGGLVVPDLGEIADEDAYQTLNHRFSNSLIIAPIVTISVLIVSILTFLLVLILGSNTHLLGIITINTIYIVLLSTLYIYTFKLSNPMFYGDFVAYKKMKSDPIFQLAQLTQYTMFSLRDSDKTIRFLWDKSRDIVSKEPLSSSIFYIMVVTNYLDGILKMDYEIDPLIDDKLKKMNLSSLCRTEQGLSLAYDLCFYEYKNKNPEQAYQKFELIQRRANQKLDKKMLTYLRNKSAHIMHLEDHEAFLKDKENLYIGNAWIFEALIKPHEMLEAYHKKLPYVEYSCPVVFKDDEEQKSDLD
ncbi:MAG: site-2 protease family protein [Acholeplasmataceae bacterium]|nr:site-2 protease family protein [Acholeplasmataceae bacterium]